MPAHLGAAFNAPPPTWGYSDQRLPLGATPAAVDLTQPSQANQGHIINVYEVTPQQGYEGTPIRIACDLKFPASGPDNGDTSGNRIRLVFGMLAVETSVQAPVNGGEVYTVSAVAPPFIHASNNTRPSWSIPVWLEAITEPFGVLERVSLGEFHYLGDASGTPKRARKKLETDSPSRKPLVAARGPIRRRREDELYPAIPAGAAASFVYDSPPATPQPGLVRTTQMITNAPAANPFVVRTKARLEIDGDLNAMKSNWSPDMWANRRCLVQFTRRQENAIVRASFKAVEEKDWTPNMIVISCLYHDARQDCYFTSVDAIYLLECLMATRYTTEEKNRIRRNLESFKPTTLQKNEGQWQDFYAHIMNYPNPKPRNIDKGLKVFPWVHLEQALKKIFANYSAYLNVPFNFNVNTSDPHGSTHVPYGHHPHPSQDSMTYADDRTVVHHAHASAGSADDISAYVDMSPVANPVPYGHRPGAPSSGNSASAASELVSPYANNTADGEFNNYVNISPTATPAVPREPYGAQLGLYVPANAQVDPSLGNGSGSNGGGATGGMAPAPQSSISYSHVNGGRTSSNSDLRVAYERPSSGAQYPQS